MRNLILIGVVAMLIGFSAVVVAQDKAPATAKCHMKFNLKGWSVFYKTAEGSGRITCNNGEKANVKIKVTGGGLTFGKMDIRDGNGTFSKVIQINEIFGPYVAAEVHAGAVKSAQASVYTKGEISLAMTGTGRGMNIGIDFGKLVISKTTK
jgi:hypothetical protein